MKNMIYFYRFLIVFAVNPLPIRQHFPLFAKFISDVPRNVFYSKELTPECLVLVAAYGCPRVAANPKHGSLPWQGMIISSCTTWFRLAWHFFLNAAIQKRILI